MQEVEEALALVGDEIHLISCRHFFLRTRRRSHGEDEEQWASRAQASVLSVCAPARFCRDFLRLDLFLLWPQSVQCYVTATCLSVLCEAGSMTPTPCSGAPTSLEMWSRGPILDDYRSFGEYYSPSEWSSPPYWSLVEQISTLSKEKILLLNECSDLRSDNQAIRVDNEQLHEAKPRLSDASLPSTCDSDGEQPPEEPSEALEKQVWAWLSLEVHHRIVV
ncbi:unnamed protein product [Symbiodinium sp. CCMP2592]|nr:unnamed protein product [Symbiodinium sp. CCMP2592]